MQHATTVTIGFLSNDPPGQDEIDELNGVIDAITTAPDDNGALQWVTEIRANEPIAHGFVPGRPPTDPVPDADRPDSTDDNSGEPWHDALYEAAYDWWRWQQANDPLSAADRLVKFSNSMSDLLSWHPEYDTGTGTWPWERDNG